MRLGRRTKAIIATQRPMARAGEETAVSVEHRLSFSPQAIQLINLTEFVSPSKNQAALNPSLRCLHPTSAKCPPLAHCDLLVFGEIPFLML